MEARYSDCHAVQVCLEPASRTGSAERTWLGSRLLLPDVGQALVVHVRRGGGREQRTKVCCATVRQRAHRRRQPISRRLDVRSSLGLLKNEILEPWGLIGSIHNLRKVLTKSSSVWDLKLL